MDKYKGFKDVQLRKPTRSTFDLSHERRMSGRIGKLMPCFVSEALPNDTFYGSTEVFVKLAPMIAPIFHRLNLYVHFFFVPNRILWEDWEEFITGGRLGEAVTTPPVPPHMNIGDVLALGGDYFDTSSVADYFGVPIYPDADVASWGAQRIDVLPFAAFQKIYFDYYADRNYVDTEWVPLPSGGLDEATYDWLLESRQRCWEHDYFTSALPWTQRGAEVLLPMAGTATDIVTLATGAAAPADKILATAAGGALQYSDDPVPSNTALAGIEWENTSITINDLRRSVALQQWLERNALAGSRYNESILAHFARKTSDARLQRAEYLGGGKAVIKIDEVMTTAYSEDAVSEVVPPGNRAGRGETYSTTNRFSYNCEEHGFVIGVLSVMPTSAYMQGMPRMFRERYEFLQYPWPSFAHLGEQEVYKFELYGNPANLANSGAPVFGYQSRYADWKFINSTSHGDFRESLDYWHLSRKFTASPTLGNAFVEFEDTLQDRIFNVSGVDTLWMYLYNNVKVKRSLPYFGTPQLS